MSKTPQFAPILNKNLDDIEPPKPFPVGHYLCIVKGLPRYDESSKKKTPFHEWTLQPTQAMDDVDEDALREFGGFLDKVLRVTFYLTDDAMWRYKDFFIACGAATEGRTPAAVINDLPNSTVVVQVKHRFGEGGRVFSEVAGFSNPADMDNDED